MDATAIVGLVTAICTGVAGVITALAALRHSVNTRKRVAK